MAPFDLVKLALEIVGPIGGAYLGTLRFAYKMGHKVGLLEAETRAQTAVLTAQSRQLEWQSRAQEYQMLRSGSVPPPREKLVTLEEPLDLEVSLSRKE